MALGRLFSALRREFFWLISPFNQSVSVGESKSALVRKSSAPPLIRSSWDDLLEGVETPHDWQKRKEILRRRYLELIRDDQKPAKPTLELVIHEAQTVDGTYTRQLISYNVDKDERAHAYLAIPLEHQERLPGMVALHGTLEHGKEQVAGLRDNPDKAYLDHLARRGYVVIAPDHFVTGHRTPIMGHYDTRDFYHKHPHWTAVGKFTFENSIAVDVLQTLDEVNAERIGVLGHSLGGHSSYFLAAYDNRIKAAVCHCGAGPFRHNPEVEQWSRDHWYIYFKHLRPLLLSAELPPIDMHEIIALIAPRAFLDISGLNDGNPLTQRQRVLMNMKLMEVYELENAPQNFAFYLHGQGHSVLHDSRALMYAWMDRHLRPPAATQTHLLTRR